MKDHRKLCCAHSPRGNDAMAVHTCILSEGHSPYLWHHCTCLWEWPTIHALQEPSA